MAGGLGQVGGGDHLALLGRRRQLGRADVGIDQALDVTAEGQPQLEVAGDRVLLGVEGAPPHYPSLARRNSSVRVQARLAADSS